MQGKCDSLALSLKDTVIHMFRLPILWAQDNQMTAEHIEIETENQKPRRMNLLNKGFVIQEDSAGFNQIKAKKIVGLFDEGELYRVEGYNDSETVYFLYDGPELTGATKLKGVNVVIHIENRLARIVKYYDKPKGFMDPPHLLDRDEMILLGFKWHVALKPVDKDDIFEWREEDDITSTASADDEKAKPATGNNRPSSTAPATRPTTSPTQPPATSPSTSPTRPADSTSPMRSAPTQRRTDSRTTAPLR
jgi:hypothetical protein